MRSECAAASLYDLDHSVRRAHWQYLPFSDFLLSGDGDLRRLLDTGAAPSVQLRSTKTGQHDELKRIHPVGTFHHSETPTSAKALVRGSGQDGRRLRKAERFSICAFSDATVAVRFAARVAR